MGPAAHVYTIELTSLLVEETLGATPPASSPLLARRPRAAGPRHAERAMIPVPGAPPRLVEQVPDAVRPAPPRRSS